MAKTPTATPGFEVKAYKLSLETAETGTSPKLNRTFSVFLFDNQGGVTTDRWQAILTFSEISVGEPNLNKKTIQLNYRRDDFEVIHAFLETNFALRRTVRCYFKQDSKGKWGGLTTDPIQIPENP
jgi:hypothetical protein